MRPGMSCSHCNPLCQGSSPRSMPSELGRADLSRRLGAIEVWPCQPPTQLFRLEPLTCPLRGPSRGPPHSNRVLCCRGCRLLALAVCRPCTSLCCAMLCSRAGLRHTRRRLVKV